MTEDSTPDAINADNSSFVEHLRLVHFTLIAACLILCIAVTSQEPSSATRAYEQADQLLRLKDLWKDGVWLRDFVDQQLATMAKTRGLTIWRSAELELIDPPNSSEVQFRFPQNHETFRPENYWLLANRGPTSSIDETILTQVSIDATGRTILPPSFDTLGGAIKIWNWLNDFRYLTVPTKLHGGWYVARYSGPNLGNVVVNIKEDSSLTTQEHGVDFLPGLILRDELLKKLREAPWEHSFGRPVGREADLLIDAYKSLSQLVSDDKGPQCYIFSEIPLAVVRAECISELVSPQLTLTAALQSAPPLGDFARSFPDVDDLAKHLTGLSLGDLQTFFLGEKNRSGEKIELPGVKLPGGAVTSWGIIIILAIESYFCVVFRELSYRLAPDDKTFNVPWIGISCDAVSRGAFAISLLLVLCAVGYLSWNGIYHTLNIWMRTLYASAMILSIYLTTVIFLCVHRRSLGRNP